MSDTLRPKKYSLEDLNEIIWGERYPLQEIECFSEEKKLFKIIDKKDSVDIIIPEDINERLRDNVLGLIDRSGARYPYRCELYPSTESLLSPKLNTLGIMYSDIHKTYDDFPPFIDWFTNWIDGRIVAPDTNIIINKYLSEVLLPLTNSRQIRIGIPRLVILEIEAIANRSETDKRLSLSAFNEIRKIRLDANAFPFQRPLDINLISSFSKISGSGRTDEFIRREIWDQIHRYQDIPERVEQVVLLTKDMIMACAANAEDIDAFYFCPAEPNKTKFTVSHEKILKIFLETAVTFGEIRLEGLNINRHIIIKGMWQGKSVIDWYSNRLIVSY